MFGIRLPNGAERAGVGYLLRDLYGAEVPVKCLRFGAGHNLRGGSEDSMSTKPVGRQLSIRQCWWDLSKCGAQTSV